jgi:hypothetical protein
VYSPGVVRPVLAVAILAGFVLPAAAAEGSPTAHCPSSGKITHLTAANTTCLVAKQVSRKLVLLRVQKTQHINGYVCTGTRRWNGPVSGGPHIYGAQDTYACRRGNRVVKWHEEVPNEV